MPSIQTQIDWSSEGAALRNLDKLLNLANIHPREARWGLEAARHVISVLENNVRYNRHELARNADEFLKTLTAQRQRMDSLTKERDSARRLLCRQIAAEIKIRTPEEIAKARDWDCFNYDCFKEESSTSTAGSTQTEPEGG